MKTSIAISVLILAIAAGLGSHEQQRLVAMRVSHGELVTVAAQLGISPDPLNRADPIRITKHTRENHEAKRLGVDVIAFIQEQEQERTTTLAALREHLATLTDEKARNQVANNAMSTLARGLAEESIESTRKWLAAAHLSPAELEGFADGVSSSIKLANKGQWIEWLGETLPPEKADDRIRDIVRNWTRNDYVAAGTWLAAAHEGPTKTSAIRAYAVAVSQYEPETAAQWAVILPPGNERDATLKRIYENWPKDNPAAAEAAAAFAKEHGLQK